MSQSMPSSPSEPPSSMTKPSRPRRTIGQKVLAPFLGLIGLFLLLSGSWILSCVVLYLAANVWVFPVRSWWTIKI